MNDRFKILALLIGILFPWGIASSQSTSDSLLENGISGIIVGKTEFKFAREKFGTDFSYSYTTAFDVHERWRGYYRYINVHFKDIGVKLKIIPNKKISKRKDRRLHEAKDKKLPYGIIVRIELGPPFQICFKGKSLFEEITIRDLVRYLGKPDSIYLFETGTSWIYYESLGQSFELSKNVPEIQLEGDLPTDLYKAKITGVNISYLPQEK